MILEIKNILITIITCLSFTILVSCGSHEQKGDDAFNRVKEEKEITNDSCIINKAMIQEPKKKEFIAQKNIQDERALYKIETEKRIHSNENKINEIKALSNTDVGLNKKVTSLEKDNNNLIIQMDEYNKEEKVKWELFKANMNQNVNEIGIELKAIKINNKK